MENLELTKQEKLELKKRGFFVIRKLTIFRLLTQLWIVSSIFFSINFLLYLANFTYEGLSFVLWIFFILYFSYQFVIGYKTFYGIGGVIGFGNISMDDKEVRKKYAQRNNLFKNLLTLYLFPFSKDGILGQAAREPKGKGLLLIGILPIIYILSGSIVWGNYLVESFLNIDSVNISISLAISYISMLIIFPTGFIFSELLNQVNPLYTFGNLGEKIQKLTPQIEQQSKQIQENFEKDMNFSVLHSGFEKLSSTFSQIVSLVLNLENIEKKANKGNLFDSTKYINSLRSDIVNPLSSLKTFLEKQKKELLNSQKEFSRVRVGGSEDNRANTELASKRSESILAELDTNILVLDEMIGKMR